MVDPLTFIGAAASIVGIVEALGTTVSTLHELHSRWKNADFTFINLIAQLTAFKAGLSKLQEWMDADLDEAQDPYHQLVIDLELNIACCKMLTHKMDSEILQLYQNAESKLDSQSKVKLMVKNGTLESLQKMVERQTSALTLLLTVCNFDLTDNSKSISDQKTLLEKSSTRKMIRRVKDDTSSLYVQCGSMSLHSRVSQCSDTLSKMSKTFEFDRELFISKVYERIHEKVLRSSRNDTVQTLRRPKKNVESTPDLFKVPAEEPQQSDEKSKSQSIECELEESWFEFDRTSLVSKVSEKAPSGFPKNIVQSLHRQKHTRKFTMNIPRTITEDPGKINSRSIDAKLQRDSRGRRGECRILVLGDDECGQVFLKQTKIFHSQGFTTEELQDYKAVVRNNVQDIMNAINSVLGEASIEMDEITKGYAQLLSQKWTNSSTSDVVVSNEAAEALQGLWASEQFSMLLQSTNFRLPSSAEYFINEISRVSQEGYIPTESDVLRAHDRRTGIREYHIDYGSLSLNMFDVSGQRPGRRKWIHQFENVNGIIYFVDLGCYNEMNTEDEDSPQNRLMESLNYFAKTVVNCRWFTRSSVILFLSNMGSFREKLGRYPLSDYCPDYTGGNDINKATKYILYRFRSVNQHTNIYPHLCEATDHRAIRLVYAAVQDTIILQNLSQFLGSVIDGKETVEERNNNDQEAMKDCDVDENLERETEREKPRWTMANMIEKRQTMTEQDIAPDESECQQM